MIREGLYVAGGGMVIVGGQMMLRAEWSAWRRRPGAMIRPGLFSKRSLFTDDECHALNVGGALSAAGFLLVMFVALISAYLQA